MPLSPADAYREAQAVFAGEVAGGTNVLSPLLAPLLYEFARYIHFYEPPYGVAYSLRVTDSWKGVTTTTATVRTGHGGGDCGYPLTLGTTYLIYAYEQNGELHTNSCSRTAEIAHAAQDLAYLHSLPTLTLSLSPPPLWMLICAGAAVGVLLALAAVAWLIRRNAAKPSEANSS
jgi:hypothetical protein